MPQSLDGSSPVSRLSPEAFSQRKAQQFAPFLTALGEASEYAKDLSSSLWEFGLRLEHARSMGVNDNDLRWMVKKGWITYRAEDGNESTEGFAACFSRGTQFVISQTGTSIGNTEISGSEHSRSNCLVGPEINPWPGEPVLPCWDIDRRELLIYGRVVKRFRWPAPNQETVLSVFSEENWPARIEDPLSQGQGLDPKRRLGDTIKCLNRNQQENLIRFRGDGTGEGVFWEILTSHSGR